MMNLLKRRLHHMLILKCFYRNHKGIELIELPEVIYFYHDSIRLVSLH